MSQMSDHPTHLYIGRNDAMRIPGANLTLVCTVLALGACAQAKQSGDSKKASGNGNATSSSGDAAASTKDMTASDFPAGIYTGIDGGSSKFSLYLPSFQPYTVQDTSIATIESVQVTLPQATVDSLVADLQKCAPAGMDTSKMSKMFNRQRTVYKLTPLKAGETKLVQTAASGGSGMGASGMGGAGGGGHGGGPSGKGGSSQWGSAKSQVLLVVNYKSDAVAKGKDRYTREGEGNKRACASCHETGEDGAPPHELGNISQIPDVAADQWITTGKLNGRVAKVQHTWEFENQDEEDGITAYLRTLQTGDVEELTKLEFENQFGNCDTVAGSGSGDGSASGTTATTTTTTTSGSGS